jgi:hypothetical protein
MPVTTNGRFRSEADVGPGPLLWTAGGHGFWKVSARALRLQRLMDFGGALTAGARHWAVDGAPGVGRCLWRGGTSEEELSLVATGVFVAIAVGLRASNDGSIEIATGGATVRIRGTVDPKTLALVFRIGTTR